MITTVNSTTYNPFSPLDDGEGVSKKINVLRSSMSKLEDEIMNIAKAFPVNQIKMARLRKIQKEIKDQIEQLSSGLIPDIIA